MEEEDLQIDEALMPEFPSYNLSEKMFRTSGEFKVLSIQYIYPGDDKKEVDVQVQVVTGHRTKFITKKLVFPASAIEYKQKLKEIELVNSLRVLRANDISLLIDIDGPPPASIEREQIKGIPDGVDVKIHYKQPKAADRATRLIIEMRVDKYVTGFEQTLVFGKNREQQQ